MHNITHKLNEFPVKDLASSDISIEGRTKIITIFWNITLQVVSASGVLKATQDHKSSKFITCSHFVCTLHWMNTLFWNLSLSYKIANMNWVLYHYHEGGGGGGELMECKALPWCSITSLCWGVQILTPSHSWWGRFTPWMPKVLAIALVKNRWMWSSWSFWINADHGGNVGDMILSISLLFIVTMWRNSGEVICYDILRTFINQFEKHSLTFTLKKYSFNITFMLLL